MNSFFSRRPLADEALAEAGESAPAETEVVQADETAQVPDEYGRNPVLSGEALADARFLRDLCVRLWRVEKRLGEMTVARDDAELDRLARRFDEAMETLRANDCLILDMTGQKFDPGLRVRVLQYEPRPDLSHETIIETVRPTLLLRGVAVEGEVIVGVPHDENEAKETQ